MEKNKNTVVAIVGVVAIISLGIYFFGVKTTIAPEVAIFPTATDTVVAVTPDTTSAPANLQTTIVKEPAVIKAKTAEVLLAGKRAPELVLSSGFSNTDPILMKDLIGKKVVLVNFWTTTSVNSLRTIPYLNQWHLKYKDKGLVILSVHTPQFAFERSKVTVDKVVFAYNMLHPIMLDNQYGTWNAWHNTIWPSQYLVDINGNIVYTHTGEGSYQAMETKINELLVARSQKLKLPVETYAAFEVPAAAQSVDLTKIKSAPLYFGSARNNMLANGTPLIDGAQYMKPFTTVLPNKIYLTGSWNISKESARSAIEKDIITFMYNAKNIYAVLGSTNMTKVRVTLDGQPLGANAGKDIRIENGVSSLYVTDERIYDIVKGADYGEHTLEMTVEGSGLEAFSVMFG